MKKRNYTSPDIEQAVVALEEGIATSATITIEESVMLEDWEEGNTDWW